MKDVIKTVIFGGSMIPLALGGLSSGWIAAYAKQYEGYATAMLFGVASAFMFGAIFWAMYEYVKKINHGKAFPILAVSYLVLIATALFIVWSEGGNPKSLLWLFV